MPIYEYVCTACGKHFEKIVRAGNDQAPCPNCGKGAERIVSRPAATAVDSAPTAGCGSGKFS